MGIYDRYILPHLINSSCNAKPIRYQRKKIVPGAKGRVLEIGMGTGLNLPYYDADKVDFVWGLEPSEGMRRKGQAAVAAAPFEVKWLDLPGEEIPLNERNKLDWCAMIKSQPVVNTKEPDTRFFQKFSAWFPKIVPESQL